MYILRNLRDINIVLFSDIMQSEDTTLLIKGDCEDKAQYKAKCDIIWLDLFDEYFKLKNNGKANSSLSKSKLNNDVRKKIVLSQYSLEVLVSLFKVYDIEKQAQQKIRIISVLRDNIREFSRLKDLDSLETTIQKIATIHEIMYRKYEMNNKRVEDETEKEIHTIERSLVDIQNVLGYHIGKPEDISVVLFVELEKSAQNKIKTMKQNGNKK